MIEEQGLIVAVEGARARVRTQRRAACGHCEVSGACGTSLLERYFGRQPVDLLALNPIGAVVGDRVAVGIGESALLRAALAAYLVPLLALIAGALLGETLGGDLAGVASLAGALGGFVLAFLWLRGYSVASRRYPGSQPMILRRLESDSIAVSLPQPSEGANGQH